MKTTYFFFLMTAVFGLSSCQNQEKKENSALETKKSDSLADSIQREKANTPDALLTDNDKSFILPAAIGGMMEVEAGNLVLQKSGDKAVKAFAALMVKDHSKANLELEKIAKAKGIELPKTMPEEQMKHMSQMQELAGRSLDVHYITMMIKDHAATVAMFTGALKYPDTALKTFISNTLPVIKGHYQQAVKLGKALNISNMNNGDDFPNVRPDTLKK